MPKHPPAPIHIRIDMQEQRSGIPALLATLPQVHIEVAPLHVGDYDVGGFNHSMTKGDNSRIAGFSLYKMVVCSPLWKKYLS